MSDEMPGETSFDDEYLDLPEEVVCHDGCGRSGEFMEKRVMPDGDRFVMVCAEHRQAPTHTLSPPPDAAD